MIKITNKINDLRLKINKIDKNIMSLILERMNLVKEVGTVKESTNTRIYVPEREASIFNSLSENSSLTPKEVQNLYTEIISTCRRLENTLSVALLKDSNSSLALKKILGEYVNPVYFSNFEKFITIQCDINYLLTPFSKDMIEGLKNYNWFIVNTISIGHESFFLLSKYKNDIFTNNQYFYFLSDTSLDNSSVKINENLYYSKITKSYQNKEEMDSFLNSYPNSFIQLVGSTVEI